jgi:branched-chain amino acid transport system permease protein
VVYCLAVRVFVEITLSGLALGSIYAVVAFGFVVVYKTSRVLNFAHGALGAAGGLMLASLVTDGGLGIGRLAGANPFGAYAGSLWGWLLNLAVAVGLASLLGVIVERLVVRPLLGREQFTVTLATIGASIVLQLFVDEAPIARTLRIPWGSDSWEVGGANIAQSALASMVLGACSFAFLVAFDRTRIGLAARAVACDQEAAVAQGINTGRVFSVTWALAAAFATLAAVAFSFSPRGNGTISTALTPALFFRALPVLAIGGWDSYRGAYLGGLVIGVLQVAAGRFLAPYIDFLGVGYPTILPYLLMIVVLMIRPAGTFGRPEIRRV